MSKDIKKHFGVRCCSWDVIGEWRFFFKKLSVFRLRASSHVWLNKAGHVLEELYTQQVKETFISLYEHSDISHEEGSIRHGIDLHKQLERVPTCNPEIVRVFQTLPVG